MTGRASEADYLQAEWDQFLAHPILGERTLQAVGDRAISSVLDVGCGAGQELVPFVRRNGATGVGVDKRAGTLLVARRLLANIGLNDVELVCARAEALPLPSGHFDLVICRHVLEYVDTRLAIAELRRALRPDGLMIIQVGTPRNELTILRAHVTAFRPHQIAGALRRMLAGAAYHLRSRGTSADSLTGSRVFYSRRLLAMELGRVGLEIVGEVPHGNPRSISVVARPLGTQGRDR